MAKRIAFLTFSAAVEERRMPLDQVASYVELDPESPVPKLRFRADALIDAPPPTYDVDSAVYRLVRADAEAENYRLDAFSFMGEKTVVAEGDSWFRLPPLFPTAIADRIRLDRKFKLTNLARWGDTLKEMLSAQEYIQAIIDHKPDYFIFSGGGNDLQIGLAAGTFLYAYDPHRPVDAYLTPVGIAALAQIGDGYRTLLAAIANRFPLLVTVCYGYDYPRPLLGSGQYIGRYLRKKGIPDNLMEPIMNAILVKVNATIADAASVFKNAVYLNCLGETAVYTWFNDMHPGDDGFRAVALKFEEAMNPRSERPVASPRAAKKRSKPVPNPRNKRLPTPTVK